MRQRIRILLESLVRACQPIRVLAHVLLPRGHDVQLHERARVLPVAVEPPPDRARAQA
jgi:hypothetical protein